METPEDKLIPFSEITDEARNIAVAWVENYNGQGLEIAQKHKLASDIMNYARNYACQVLDKAASESKVVGTHPSRSEPYSSKEIHTSHAGWEIKVDKQSILDIKNNLL